MWTIKTVLDDKKYYPPKKTNMQDDKTIFFINLYI